LRLFQKEKREDALLQAIKNLNRDVTELKGEREGTREELRVTRDYVSLKKQLTDLEIQYDREQEKHEREKRDIEHMVGLEKKRQEFELESARRDVTLSLREENLAAERQRFEEHTEFIVNRFEKEAGRREELMKELLARLPTVRVDRHIKEFASANGNGNGNGEED